MSRRAVRDALTLDEQQAAHLAMTLRRCFPCGATCRQRQAFAEAVHRRFVKLGGVAP